MRVYLIIPHVRHPLSCALPEYAEPELKALANSIKEHGQRYAIIAFEGQILDGWNRLLACAIAETEPEIRELTTDETAVSVVLTNNFDCRELSKTQKSFALVDIFFIVNELWSRSTHPTPALGSRAAPLHWSQATVWKQTKAQLAERAGVKPRMMQDVLRIRTHGEQRVIDAVRRGDISVEDASPMVAYDIDGQYNSLQNHCDGKAARRAKRIEIKSEEAAQRAEVKRNWGMHVASAPQVEVAAMQQPADAIDDGRRPSAPPLLRLIRDAEYSLHELCVELTHTENIVGRETACAELAAVCREYLTRIESFTSR